MRWGWKRAGNGDAGAGNGGNPGGKSGVRWREIRCPGNPVSVHHSCPGKSGGKSGVEIRCQFIILARGGNPVSVHHSCPGGKSGGNPVSVHHSCPGRNPVSVHQGGNPVSVHHSCPGRNPVSVHQGGNPVSVHRGEIRCRKSGVGEIRCQFIRGEIRCRKSGVSSSFLPEKMNRHRITQAIVEAPGSIRDSGGRTLTTSPHLPQGEMP